MAHKKAAGSAKNLRDSNPKYRGVKLFGGQVATAGNIVVRQKGDVYLPGRNSYKSKDFTIHASIDGVVQFRKKKIIRYDGRKYLKTIVDIVPAEDVASESTASGSAPKKQTEKKTKTTKKTTSTKKTTKKADKPAAKKETKKPTTKKETTKKDDLTKITGLGPKSLEALTAAGITTYQGLVDAGEDDIKQALEDGGTRVTDPAPWIAQAKKLLT